MSLSQAFVSEVIEYAFQHSVLEASKRFSIPTHRIYYWCNKSGKGMANFRSGFKASSRPFSPVRIARIITYLNRREAEELAADLAKNEKRTLEAACANRRSLTGRVSLFAP